MATISISNELDVLDKFTCLMKESVASESVYIRTKETLESFVNTIGLSKPDKAEIISNILGSMSSSITSSAMQTALQWATAEKDIALRKLTQSKELDILDADKAIKEAQKEKLCYESIATQAETIRMYGTPQGVNGCKLGTLRDEGKLFLENEVLKVEIPIADERLKNTIGEGVVIKSRANESYAAIHKTVADAVTQFGYWNYSLTPDGINTAVRQTAANVEPLADIQRVSGKEQAKGYVYNAWANGLTAQAGMIGTALASEMDLGNDKDNLLLIFRNLVNKLSNLTPPNV